jgi:glycosyltransferase involved in cell wall biosynthesis
VLAIPSLTEGFPNVIGEALALRVPIVASDCSPGVAEYLDGGRCGLLGPPADPSALARAIERVLVEPGLEERLVEAGTDVVEELDLPKVLRRYEDVLRDATRA